MDRRRKTSPCDVYHITSRGVGGQIIFEDDEDNRHFLCLLKKSCANHSIKVAAWCLMGNHFHLLLNAPIENISLAMQELKRSYAVDTNNRYKRNGHLFQGKFSSFPIADESYFAAAIRYIHNNPVRAGLAKHPSEYKWSSYQEYLGKRFLLDDSLMLDIGAYGPCGLDYADDCFPKCRLYSGKRLSDEDICKEIKGKLNITSPTTIKGFNRSDRDTAIKRISEIGAYPSQIARITGLSQTTVSRAVKADDGK